MRLMISLRAIWMPSAIFAFNVFDRLFGKVQSSAPPSTVESRDQSFALWWRF
jgi:hypothetical protein